MQRCADSECWSGECVCDVTGRQQNGGELVGRSEHEGLRHERKRTSGSIPGIRRHPTEHYPVGCNLRWPYPRCEYGGNFFVIKVGANSLRRHRL